MYLKKLLEAAEKGDMPLEIIRRPAVDGDEPIPADWIITWNHDYEGRGPTLEDASQDVLELLRRNGMMP